MGIGSDALGSVLGLVETAYLMVDDSRANLTEAEAAEDNALDSLFGAVNQKIAQTQDIVSRATDILNTPAMQEQTQEIRGKIKFFKVQFNPSELQINVTGNPAGRANLQPALEGGDKTATDTTLIAPRCTLSLTLHFDQMNKADAFMADKFSLSPAELASNIATGVQKLLGKEYSVRPQVEAIMAALRNPATRKVAFFWADFQFTGMLMFASSRYTMFSPSGHPVRGQVSVRIIQQVSEAEGEDGLGFMWQKGYQKTFPGLLAQAKLKALETVTKS